MDPNIEQQIKALRPNHMGGFSPSQTGNVLKDFILRAIQTAPMGMRGPTSTITKPPTPAIMEGNSIPTDSPGMVRASKPAMPEYHVNHNSFGINEIPFINKTARNANSARMSDKELLNKIWEDSQKLRDTYSENSNVLQNKDRLNDSAISRVSSKDLSNMVDKDILGINHKYGNVSLSDFDMMKPEANLNPGPRHPNVSEPLFGPNKNNSLKFQDAVIAQEIKKLGYDTSKMSDQQIFKIYAKEILGIDVP